MANKKQQVQWYVTAEETVIEAAAPVDDPQARTYARFETTRPVTLDDLYTFEDRLTRLRARWDAGTTALLVLIGLGVAGAVVGWLVLPRVGASDDVAGWLFYASLAVLVLAVVTSMSLAGILRRRVERLYLRAGLASSQSRGLKRRQAEEIIHARGTVAGRLREM